MDAGNRVSPIKLARVTGWPHLIHPSVYWKDLQDKWKFNVVLTPFEYRTAVIFQALIPTLNAFQTSGGINLLIWIGESVLQTMQCHLCLQ